MADIVDDTIKDVKQVQEDLSKGHVSTQEASQAVNHINKAWDNFAVNCKQNGVDLEKLSKSTWGNETFDAFSGIKNGAATGMSGVASFFDAVDTFKGNWRDPQVARKKIEQGLTQISSGVVSLGRTFKNIAKSGRAIGKVLSGASGHPMLNKIGGGLSTASTGIGSFGGNLVSMGAGLQQSGLIASAGIMTESITALANGLGTNAVSGTASSFVENGQNGQNNMFQEEDDTSKKDKVISPQGDHPDTSQAHGGEGNEENDYTADMVSEIVVVLDGIASSENSSCTINGVCYRLSGYSLSQELLQPMILLCSLEKNDKQETQSDVVFTDFTQIIGKSIEISVSTVKAGKDSKDAQPQKAFVFKGFVIDVSASRSTASAQSASVTIATWDALMQNAPHCRSFEDMTLKEIVETVLKPYKEIKSEVAPRFKEKIPYIVQYNQSDYAFLRMLASRFGEWMYDTGEIFVFGEMLDLGDSVKLEYPGGSLLSYNLVQQMDMFSFNHLLPDYYQFGQEKGILNETAKGIADGEVNTWTEKAYNASLQRYNRDQLMALESGGFDDGKSAEGADSILDYSLKVEALGKKTHLMSVQGYSKLAMLQIGRDFLIRDKVQNVSGQSEDIEQKTLKIIGVSHSFDYGQSYSNSFTAVPQACEYPSYSDANVHVSAPTQRATVVDNNDELQLGRVRVQFPWQTIQGKEVKTPWLRIAVPYAGLGKGQQFVPEIGEEVMVGFEMNNPERPYVIGTFYNGNGKPDEAWAVNKDAKGTKNNVKAIRSRNGHTILFNDQGDKGLLEIYDNKNNAYHITFSSDDNKITIHSAGQIEVFAENDIEVHAKGNFGLNAEGNIDIKSKGNVTIDAQRVMTLKAQQINER